MTKKDKDGCKHLLISSQEDLCGEIIDLDLSLVSYARLTCGFLKETDATAVTFYNMEEGNLSHKGQL